MEKGRYAMLPFICRMPRCFLIKSCFFLWLQVAALFPQNLWLPISRLWLTFSSKLKTAKNRYFLLWCPSPRWVFYAALCPSSKGERLPLLRRFPKWKHKREKLKVAPLIVFGYSYLKKSELLCSNTHGYRTLLCLIAPINTRATPVLA